MNKMISEKLKKRTFIDTILSCLFCLAALVVKSQVKHTIFRQKIYKPFATKYTRLMRDGLAVREAV